MLKVKNITCGYNSKVILHNISFDVKTREIIGIIGPNGCGKTTLLRAITGVVKLKMGEVQLEGKSIRNMSYKEVARKMAVVSQVFEDNYMTVEEFIMLGRIPYYKKLQFFESKEDENIAEKYMNLTGIHHLKDQMLSKISGGEKQLALIARALCQQTKLLLLDEPTAHLDISHKIEIMDMIKRLRRDHNITVIVVMHDLNLAGEYCDRLILINNGLIHSVGTPREVLTYSNIEDVYNAIVVVKENPVSMNPHVFVVSEEFRKKDNV